MASLDADQEHELYMKTAVLRELSVKLETMSYSELLRLLGVLEHQGY